MLVEIVNNNNLDKKYTSVSFQKAYGLESAARDALQIVKNKAKSPPTLKVRQIIRLFLHHTGSQISNAPPEPELLAAQLINDRLAQPGTHKSVKHILRTLLRLGERLPEVKKAKFEAQNINFLEAAKIKLYKTQASDNEKKRIITKLFTLKASEEEFGSTMISDYIHGRLVPFIASRKHNELAQHILQITEKPLNKRTAGSITERIKLIAKLGSAETHLSELNLYTHAGGQIGIPDFIKQEKPETLEQINQAACAAIEKLTTAPNF